MEAIVAVFSDWGIGREGTQQLVLKADRKHFRELTDGAAVLVGRRTMEDFPNGAPLKGRRNLVLTRREIEIPGAEVVHSTREALDAALSERCLVIGGASVFRQMIPWTDRVYVTKIALTPPSDSFFPNLDEDPAWVCTEAGPWLTENNVKYSFCTYIRKTPEEKK
ncbi:MAG: dihydrofolate reductase [Oscillospiraceae bacterium]|nr:dihydrofolate reductase [Oscillospiraceae bacterium]